MYILFIQNILYVQFISVLTSSILWCSFDFLLTKIDWKSFTIFLPRLNFNGIAHAYFVRMAITLEDNNTLDWTFAKCRDPRDQSVLGDRWNTRLRDWSATSSVSVYVAYSIQCRSTTSESSSLILYFGNTI